MNEENNKLRGKSADFVHFDDAIQFITPPAPTEEDLYVHDPVTNGLISIAEWRRRYEK